MQFRILGPLEVVDDQGTPVPVGGGRQLGLFALLLLNANKVVSTDRLVDELWSERPPATAEKIVRNYVSLLRKQLGDRIVRRAPGYLLRVEAGELDSERFESLVREAHEQPPAAAVETLRQALGLWTGAPLAEVAYEPFAQQAIARLEQERLQALEDRIDVDLQLGRERNVLPELERLVREQPLRERPRSLLMLALYRAGRQTDALDVYQDARRTLVDELGLEPSPALQELQRRILAHDPALAGPGQRTSLRARRRRGGLLIVAGGVVLLAAGIAAGTVALTRDSGAAALSKVDANSVGVIDVRTNRIVGEVPVGSAPTRLALAGNSLWVVNTGDSTVSRIDVKRRVQIRTITVPGPPSGIAANEKAAWVVYLRSRDAGGVGAGSAGAALVDPRFNDVSHTVVLNQRFEYQDAIAVGLGSVWAADPAFITRLDPSGRFRKLIPIDYTSENSIDIGHGAVWAVNGLGIVRIDPATNVPLTIPTAQTGTGGGPSPTAVAVGDGAVWVANRYVVGNGFSTSRRRGTVSRIDPQTNAVVETIPVGHDPFAIAAGNGGVWVANRTDSTIMRIDPRTNEVVKTIEIGGRPEGLAAGSDTVWVSVD
jgi:YVTN family beta-propeller protein